MAQIAAYQSLQVCRIRAVRLGATGVPATGASAGYVSDAIVTVRLAFDYQAGVEIQSENGCGGIAAYYKGPDVLRKINISFELCDLDSELIELLTTASVLTSGGNTTGFDFPQSGACTTDTNYGVALEFWSNRWDGCAAPSGAEANLPYWHWIFPKVTARIGDMTMENGFLRVPVEGYAQENRNYGKGPWSEYPGTSLDTIGAVFADSSMPAASVTYITVP